MFRDQEVRALLLPAAEDPRALFNADVSAVRFGPFWPFWLCELAEGDAN